MCGNKLRHIHLKKLLSTYDQCIVRVDDADFNHIMCKLNHSYAIYFQQMRIYP